VRVLIAGGGVAGLEALLALQHLSEERVEIDLLAPQRDFVYRPFAVAEPFGIGRAHRFDLDSIIRERGGRFRADGLVSVDPDRRVGRTRSGAEIGFDSLIIAVGAAAREAIPAAVTFWGSPGSGAFGELLTVLEQRRRGSLVFALPGGAGWPLPVYELAILTREHLASRGAAEIQITVVTHEAAPLELFGSRASQAIATLLSERGIALCPGHYPSAVERGELALVPSGRLEADWVVTPPRLEGRPIPGIPHGEGGFVPVDEHGRVPDLAGVYAAGDATSFPIKQGGIAIQQADAVAEAVAVAMGASRDPQPFRPVLRGLLLTGAEPAFLRAELSGGRGETSAAAPHALWWPPGKIAGGYLAPYLAALGNAELPPAPPPDVGALAVDVEVHRESTVLH
jgi:sulfide:quinone oxidoreductase